MKKFAELTKCSMNLVVALMVKSCVVLFKFLLCKLFVGDFITEVNCADSGLHLTEIL